MWACRRVGRAGPLSKRGGSPKFNDCSPQHGIISCSWAFPPLREATALVGFIDTACAHRTRALSAIHEGHLREIQEPHLAVHEGELVMQHDMMFPWINIPNKGMLPRSADM